MANHELLSERDGERLSKCIMATPIVGPDGNHSGRLVRVIENLISGSHGAVYQQSSVAVSRIGIFARYLAKDLAEGVMRASDAVTLLNQLADIGDWVFDAVQQVGQVANLNESVAGSPSELRQSLVEPIPEIFAAAKVLKRAVDQHEAGNHDAAELLFRQADDSAVRAFTEAGWGKGAAARYKFLQLPNAPPCLPVELRPKPRMPTAATQAEVLKRDGHHCRFCGIPVIAPRIRKLMLVAYPNAVGWGGTNLSQHAAFQCMWLQYDHLLPNSRGGDSSAANVVVTCAVCNFGRMQATIEEARLVNPLSHSTPERWDGFGDWDGLGSLLSVNRLR